MKLFKSFSFVFLFSFLILSSCKKDQLLTDSSAKLDFSTDSVLFDTVFHYAGSTTKLFRIYNHHKQTMNISKAFLAGGASSAYKLNIDGISTTASAPILKDIEILGGDSLYVFVQVHVNPSQNAPLLIKDSIIFETNGNIQNVKLTAIGQDVYLHKPDHFPTNGFPAYSIITCNAIWTNDKPHLIFGYAVVDSACTLTMLQGTHVYLHNHAVLWVYKDGTLIVKGQKGNEVTFQGDRLEPDYKELPGQWGKIWLSAGSKNNTIDWAIIKNGNIGVQADTVVTPGIPNVCLTNTIIKNMQVAALYGQGTHIWSTNCVFANCGQYVAALTIGGSYKFEQCTFANFWTGGQRTTPLLAMNNYYTSGSTLFVRPLDSCYFGNCILYGDIADEIGIDSTTAVSGNNFSYKFDHCILKTNLNTPNGIHYNSILKNDPLFKDASNNNYQLTTSSPAKDYGYINLITTDLNDQPRPNPNTSIPDLGAYEFY